MAPPSVEQWTTCPDVMTLHAWAGASVSERKLLLFLCACCRELWPMLGYEASRDAVRLAEESADAPGIDLDRPLHHAWQACLNLHRSLGGVETVWRTARSAQARSAAQKEAERAERVYRAALAAHQTLAAALALSRRARAWVPEAFPSPFPSSFNQVLASSRQAANPESDLEPRLAELYREIVNPFAPTVDPAWKLWRQGTLPRLAEAIHREASFDQLPILADALEEFGCTDRALLEHCLRPHGHVRGCWLLDLLRGLG